MLKPPKISTGKQHHHRITLYLIRVTRFYNSCYPPIGKLTHIENNTFLQFVLLKPRLIWLLNDKSSLWPFISFQRQKPSKRYSSIPYLKCYRYRPILEFLVSQICDNYFFGMLLYINSLYTTRFFRFYVLFQLYVIFRCT